MERDKPQSTYGLPLSKLAFRRGQPRFAVQSTFDPKKLIIDFSPTNGCGQLWHVQTPTTALRGTFLLALQVSSEFNFLKVAVELSLKTV